MNGRTPHIVQYQGSKRIHAPQIPQYMPKHFNRLLEPFAGMAAITVAVANERHANKYIISDINEPIVRLLQTVIDNPYELTQKYSSLWAEQFEYNDEHFEHFYHVGDDFNSGNKSPENIL